MSGLKLYRGLVSRGGRTFLKYADGNGSEYEEEIRGEQGWRAVKESAIANIEEIRPLGFVDPVLTADRLQRENIISLVDYASHLRLRRYLSDHPIPVSPVQLTLSRKPNLALSSASSIFEYRNPEAAFAVKKYGKPNMRGFNAHLVDTVREKLGKGQSKALARVFDTPQLCAFAVQLMQNPPLCFILDEDAKDEWPDTRIIFADNRSLTVRVMWWVLVEEKDWGLTQLSFDNGTPEYIEPPRRYYSMLEHHQSPAIESKEFKNVLSDIQQGKPPVDQKHIDSLNAARNMSTRQYVQWRAKNNI